jgi:hypothetical protein
MSAPTNCQLVGRWRIVEADLWDRDYLDLRGPAMITIPDHGRGEIALGALQTGLDIDYSRSSVGFTWEGFDEMDEVSGDGSAELLDDDSIKIEFAYYNGGRSCSQSQTGEFFNSLPGRSALLERVGVGRMVCSGAYGGCLLWPVVHGPAGCKTAAKSRNSSA